jgi:Flp pilus assembly pilin Flp
VALIELADQRGSVLLEYAIVLCLVSVGAVSALVACGVLLLRFFLYQQALLLLPFP